MSNSISHTGSGSGGGNGGVVVVAMVVVVVVVVVSTGAAVGSRIPRFDIDHLAALRVDVILPTVGRVGVDRDPCGYPL